LNLAKIRGSSTRNRVIEVLVTHG